MFKLHELVINTRNRQVLVIINTTIIDGDVFTKTFSGGIHAYVPIKSLQSFKDGNGNTQVVDKATNKIIQNNLNELSILQDNELVKSKKTGTVYVVLCADLLNGTVYVSTVTKKWYGYVEAASLVKVLDADSRIQSVDPITQRLHKGATLKDTETLALPYKTTNKKLVTTPTATIPPKLIHILSKAPIMKKALNG